MATPQEPQRSLADALEHLLAPVEAQLAHARTRTAFLAEDNRNLRHRIAALEARLSRPAAPAPRCRRAAGKSAPGRVTPPEVTTAVDRAVISKLGSPTAAQIAEEITRHGPRSPAAPSATSPSAPAPTRSPAPTGCAATAWRADTRPGRQT